MGDAPTTISYPANVYVPTGRWPPSWADPMRKEVLCRPNKRGQRWRWSAVVLHQQDLPGCEYCSNLDEIGQASTHTTFDHTYLQSRVHASSPGTASGPAHAACSFRAFLLLPRLSVDWRVGLLPSPLPTLISRWNYRSADTTNSNKPPRGPDPMRYLRHRVVDVQTAVHSHSEVKEG